MILEHWNLPEPIVLVVRHRLDPDSSPARTWPWTSCTTGDVVAKMSGIGLGLDGMQLRPEGDGLRQAGPDHGTPERAMEDAIEHFFEIRDILATAG
jgi:hypothetical protein